MIMSTPSKRVYPADIIDSPELMKSIETATVRNKPYRARSVDFSVSTKNRAQSMGMSSFMSTVSNNGSGNGVEVLINYLSANIEKIKNDREYLRKFETLTTDTLHDDRDVDLHRTVKSHGWSGSHYRQGDTNSLDAQSLLQALSNIYLRHKMTSYTAHITNLFGLGDEKGADQILSFCPNLLLTCLREGGTFPPLNREDVSSCTFTGACMLADISGFSKFSAAMCQRGVEGLDELREATNGFLGHIVKLVYHYKGDVIAFAGDALICVFLETPDVPAIASRKHGTEDNINTEITNARANSSYRALKCACKLREHKTNKLSSHIGITYGEMKIALLGGIHDQWVYLLNGSCVSELAGCINDAGPKEVVVSKECYEEAMQSFIETPAQGVDGKPIFTTARRRRPMSGFFEYEEDSKIEEIPPVSTNICPSGNVLIKDIDTLDSCIEMEETAPTAASTTPTTAVNAMNATQRDYHNANMTMNGNGNMRASEKSPRDASQFGMNSVGRASSSRKMSVMVRRAPSRQLSFSIHNSAENSDSDEECEGHEDNGGNHALIEHAAMFVPRPVLAAVYSESLDHIGELREVTTMFLSLDSYSPDLHRDPTTLQPFFVMAQKILFESGGYLRQFLVDDKGCVFIAMWGMPSFTYTNNCSRALYCAVQISIEAKKLEHETSIGITTGNVFCGSVGALERRDYAGIGNEVNLAARLMSKAKSRVLLDNPTFSNLNEQTKQLLIPAEEMKLKGMENPVTPFQYNSAEIPRLNAVDESVSHGPLLRKATKQLLTKQADKIVNASSLPGGRKVNFTLIIGLPGTGKSTAAEFYRHNMYKHHVSCILIQARPGHEGVPYGLMRELFLELVGEDNFQTEEQQRTKIQELIDSAYVDADEDVKANAKMSLEIVLGVEWGEVNFGGGETDSVRGVNGASNRSRADSIDRIPSNDSPTTSPPGSHRNSPLRLTSPRNAVNAGGSGPSTPIPVSGMGGGNDLLKVAMTNASHGAVTPDILSAATSAITSSERSGKQNSLRVGNTDDDAADKLSRTGDKTFYRVLAVLFGNEPYAVVIEDAHYCDELSWNELHMLLVEGNLNLSILVTMRPPPGLKTPNNPNSNAANFLSNVGIAGGGTAMGMRGDMTSGSLRHEGINSVYSASDRISGKRKSVLAALADDALREAAAIATNVATTSGGTVGTSEGGSSADKSVKVHISESYMAILGHENTVYTEMVPLQDDDVREILKYTLQVDDISNEVIRLVMDVSSGNAYWCKAIANFIKERGVKELEKATAGDSKQNSLKQLILLRMEKLTVDQQLLLKCASIIADEFSVKMLQALLPEKLRASVPEMMKALAEHGFIVHVSEGENAIFAFDNLLIQQTISELTPPRDAAHVHVGVAEFLEREFAKDLRPLYIALGHHYQKSNLRRHLAFKYRVKAADQAISRGAFSDGFRFTQAAADLAESKPELNMLLKVISMAIRCISKQNSSIGVMPARRLSGSFVAGVASPLTASSNNHSSTNNNIINTNSSSNNNNSSNNQGQGHGLRAEYLKLKIAMEAKLEKLLKGHVKAEEASPGNKNRIVISKQPSARLTWQPSYLAQNENQDSSDDEEDSDEEETVKKKGMCVLS
jgi:class 3 adenylate cyclase